MLPRGALAAALGNQTRSARHRRSAMPRSGAKFHRVCPGGTSRCGHREGASPHQGMLTRRNLLPNVELLRGPSGSCRAIATAENQCSKSQKNSPSAEGGTLKRARSQSAVRTEERTPPSQDALRRQGLIDSRMRSWRVVAPRVKIHSKCKRTDIGRVAAPRPCLARVAASPSEKHRVAASPPRCRGRAAAVDLASRCREPS